MAETVLYNMAARIISTLGSSFLDEIWLLQGAKNELDKLKRTLSTIEAVLLDAEEKSIENHQVKNWLGMLSEAMYDADDLLDDFSTEALRQQVQGGSKAAKTVRLFFSSSNQFAFGLKMAHKIKVLRQRLDEIAAEKNKFHLEERFLERAFVAKGRGQTHSSPPEVVVGRQHEREEIVKLLLSSDFRESVSVVPIVGIGGLGKSTLAQMVYNDDKVKNHFELRMWVCVSDDFDVHLIVKKILESATGQPTENIEMDPLKNLLHERISGRRYLLVLDDVWNEDVSKWSTLKDLLVVGARGSKIVITTRIKKVAEMSRPIYIYDLRVLSEEEAWSLFKQMALKLEQELNQSHEAIGREIVAKCCGLPLAIKTIGGMLYFKDLETEWLLFKNEELSKIDVYKNDILPVLKLSYNHLPSHYKHCFAYCSLYPKDYKIPVEQLMQQWKAHGYLNLKSTDSNECLQDVGFGCFVDLFRLSFFQDVEKDEFGNIKSCKMHDLMHDLAISVAGDNFSTSNFGRTRIKEKTQHVSYLVMYIMQDFSPLRKAKKIRTILTQDDTYFFGEELDAVFHNLRCLRVLSLSGLIIDELPSSIYKLKHIRFLNLCGNHFRKLPDSITNLYNLQVLNICGCSSLKQLPNNIEKLINLTDLDNDKCDELTHMPRGIGKLTRLETLSTFKIAKHNSIFRRSGGLDELHGLNKLKGSLEITNLRYVKNVASEFKAANLNAKKQIENLTLNWIDFRDIEEWFYDRDLLNNFFANDGANDEMGLEALRPHQSLKRLSVEYYRGVRPPSWLPSLTNLVSVHFFCCGSIQWLPPFDQLPYLKSIKLNVTTLEHIDVGVNFENGGSSSFFPCLTDLTLKYCPNLKGFVRCQTTDVVAKPSPISMEELPCFPRLSRLVIVDCPNLTYMPLFPELKILKLKRDGIKSLMEVVKAMTSFASESTSSPFSTLSQLEHLIVSDTKDCPADELLQYLPSLQNLEFVNCTFKTVSSDEKDDGLQWQSLKVLRSVDFSLMENLVCLPKGLQYVTTLQNLEIYHCDSLASIPEWMGDLIALQHLTIYKCLLLSERCKNNTAEDWLKISHIPDISIDDEIIQRNGCYLL